MTSTRRTAHDRVRQQADDSGPRRPLRGDLAYDTATSRTGVVMEVPKDTGITFHRLTPEGGGEEVWNASVDTLMPPEDVPSGAAGQQPEYAPWADSPDPNPSLQARAERGMERFLGSAGKGELR
ncbi:hypothetical protein ACWGCI_12725 [Streptomyces sp. NPDC054949]|uniref:hypothetical protein n=1 Tax=unclassified Streptomyces TaxID=2593676 RepID=UPI00224D2AD8|nr:hypothetical protein [Streptomyces sp. NBC_00291]MCX5155649.1 hypothetical protein [Streptomyces sp. NBC_00291]